jgi:hypothetical protein
VEFNGVVHNVSGADLRFFAPNTYVYNQDDVRIGLTSTGSVGPILNDEKVPVHAMDVVVDGPHAYVRLVDQEAGVVFGDSPESQKIFCKEGVACPTYGVVRLPPPPPM